MSLTGLILAVAVSALVVIIADGRGHRRVVYVFKPMTTALVCGVALAVPAPVSEFYRGAIVLGLVFSLGGDVLLMLPSDRFAAGLGAFLVTHFCYIAAFSSELSSLPLAAGALLLGWGALLVRVLWPRLNRLRLPVIVYASVLLAMAWTALGQQPGLLQGRAAFAGVGAILFVASDSALVLERFVRQHRWGAAVVLSTYFAAQVLIALSISAR